MYDQNVIERCRALSDSEIVAVLRQALFAGLRPEDYVLATIILLLPERIDELAAKLAELSTNPAPIPPVFREVPSPL